MSNIGSDAPIGMSNGHYTMSIGFEDRSFTLGGGFKRRRKGRKGKELHE